VGDSLVSSHITSEEAMLIRHSTWGMIRSHFSEIDKEDLRNVITGETVCPPGIVIDPDKLVPELASKIKRLVKEHQP
jgi:hypothetical protein